MPGTTLSPLLAQMHWSSQPSELSPFISSVLQMRKLKSKGIISQYQESGKDRTQAQSQNLNRSSQKPYSNSPFWLQKRGERVLSCVHKSKHCRECFCSYKFKDNSGRHILHLLRGLASWSANYFFILQQPCWEYVFWLFVVIPFLSRNNSHRK